MSVPAAGPATGPGGWSSSSSVVVPEDHIGEYNFRIEVIDTGAGISSENQVGTRKTFDSLCFVWSLVVKSSRGRPCVHYSGLASIERGQH